MSATIKELRRPTLQETYLAVDEWLKCAQEGQILEAVKASNLDAFDQSLKMIILDRCKYSSELKDCLFAVDVGIVRRAVKCSWFFETTPNKFFVEELFPVVSVSTRLKVITALAKHAVDEQVEELYDFVRSQYGFRTAEPLLARCSHERINQAIACERTLKPSTLLAISRRFPDVAIGMLKQKSEESGRKEDLPAVVVNYMLRNHPSLMISQLTLKELKAVLSWDGKMGRKLSRSVMKTHGDIIMSFLWESRDILSSKGNFFRYFTEDAQTKSFQQLIAQPTLKRWDGSLEAISKEIKGFPSAYREILLQRTFFSVFGWNLWETPKAWSTTLLEMVTPERRAVMLRAHECQSDEYIYLNPPVVAIPKLITLVKRTPESPDRARIVEKMIRSCKLERNLEQVQVVCTFVEEHMAEEHLTVVRVVKAVLNDFGHPDLPRSMWSFLVRMTRRVFSEGHRKQSLFAAHEGLIGHYISRGEDPSNLIRDWVADLKRCSPYEILRKPFYPHSKAILGLLYEYLPQLTKNEEYLESVLLLNFNILNLPDKGELLANLVSTTNSGETLNKAFSAGLYRYPSLLEGFVQQTHCLVPLLKLVPNLVVDHFENIVMYMLDSPYKNKNYFNNFLHSKRLLTFYNLPGKVAEQCLKYLGGKTSEESTRSGLYVYSHVAPFNDFILLAEPYLSTKSRLNVLDQDTLIVRSIPHMLRYIRPLKDTLPLILPCLVGSGDLLYRALPAFHSFCYTYPVGEVSDVLLPYLEAPVSVKKKVLRILVHVCTVDRLFNCCIDLWPRTIHYSARDVLLKCIISLFFEVRTELAWRAVDKCIAEADDTSLESLASLSRIPDTFFSVYVESVWKVLSRRNVKYYIKDAFIDEATHRMGLLENDFCENLIAVELFKEENSAVNYFTLHYLLLKRKTNNLSDALQFILPLFEERVGEKSKHITQFIRNLCEPRSYHRFRLIHGEFMVVFGHIFETPKLMEARLVLKYFEFSKSAENSKDWNTAGNDMSEYWLSIPDYSLMAPLFASTLGVAFTGRDHWMYPVLVGILRDDSVIAMAVLMTLPTYYHGYDPDIVMMPPSLNSIDWADSSKTSEQCMNYILSFCGKVSSSAVQQYLAFLLSEYHPKDKI